MEESTERRIGGAHTRALVYTFVGAAFVLTSVLVAFSSSYVKPSEAAEATLNIRKLYDGSIAYFEEHARYPASTPLYPELDCAERESAWDAPTWQALQFGLVDPHRFSFQYDSSGSGASAQFTASAFGDLDCDGVASTFVRFGSVREIEVDGGSPRLEVFGSNGLYIANELE